MTRVMKSAAAEKLCLGQKAALLKQFRQFHRDEGGSMIAYSLLLFIAMLIIGGAAVDIMRAEHQRAKIQYTTDRAVLAATSLKQAIPAQDIMDDYFAKEGMGAIAPVAHVEGDDGYRKVSAYYPDGQSPYINTMFMRWVGVNTLPTPSYAVAEDGVSRVEISLVLDASGSMGSSAYTGNTKIKELKIAAGKFFDVLLIDPPEPDTYSISIVPYSTQVTVGEDLLSKYTVTAEHGYSHCVDFENGDFNSVAISTGGLMQRTGHFAPWTSSTSKPVNDYNRACVPGGNGRDILPLSTDIDDLKAYVNSLQASGWTGTEIGAKWGAALLDPSARPAITDLIDDGAVDALVDGRPFDYDKDGIMKVMVVMSDGANTNQYMLDPAVASGLSPVWKYKKDGVDRYEIFNPDRAGDQYFHTYKNSTSGEWVAAPMDTGTITAVQMSYVELWDHATMKYVSKYMFKPAGLPNATWNSNGWSHKFSRLAYAAKDDRMQNICAAARAKGIRIFTIGFEVTADNNAKLMACSTNQDGSHHYKVDADTDLSTAFSSIAAQLHNLRLIR